MRILGIDPGEDVGFSLLDTDLNREESWQFNIKDHETPHLCLYHKLEVARPDVIACEDFYHIPRYMKLRMITSELIGTVKLYGQQRDIEVIMQNRGMKTGWPAAKLKLLGLWKPGKDYEDAMDALRHRLVYQEQHDMIDWSKLK